MDERGATPPAGLRVRPGTPDDADVIAGVVNDRSIAEIGVPWVTPAEIRDDFSPSGYRPPGLEPVVLIDASDVVVGYLSFAANPDPFEVDFFCSVRASLAGSGANAWLLGFGERRALAAAPEGSGVKVGAGLFRGVDDAVRLFTALGYRRERTFWMMRADVADAPEAEIPDGIEIRRYEPGADDVEVHAALTEAFDDHWGWPFPPYDEWRQHAIEGEGSAFDPGFWFVATSDGRIVGAAVGTASSARNERAAYVDDLGVRRAWRRRGVARALLLTLFAEARGRGIPQVELAVDSESETGATALYERAGMRVEYAWEEWTKPIPPAE